MRHVQAVLIAFAVAALAVLVVFTIRSVGSPDASEAGDLIPVESKQGVEDELTVVTVIGDSFTGGSNMNDGPSWPALVAAQEGWVVNPLAIGGTGYVAAGPDPDSPQTFLQRAGLVTGYTSDLVILAGGRNDQGDRPAVVERAARQTIRAVHDASPSSEIVVFSTFSSGNPTANADAVTTALRRAAKAEGEPFIDVSRLFAGPNATMIGEDGVHPTQDGHDYLASQIPKLLKAADLPRTDAWGD